MASVRDCSERTPSLASELFCIYILSLFYRTAFSNLYPFESLTSTSDTVVVYKTKDLERYPGVRLSRGEMILIALMAGGHYDPVCVSTVL
jgi:hypothetical protein